MNGEQVIKPLVEDKGRTQPRGGGNTRALHELSCEPAISQSDLSACVERSLLVAQSRGTHSSSPSGVGARHHGLIFCNNRWRYLAPWTYELRNLLSLSSAGVGAL
uniref:Uncharacterized protein n=1 Tax=Timema bartmani TaxID=61472 RepID=A0A7R9F438_9NEOP|nr:unnamed protein product [Timema bartmani]